MMKTFSFLIPSKYKPVHGRAVATAMVTAAKNTAEGFFLLEYRGIKQ